MLKVKDKCITKKCHLDSWNLFISLKNDNNEDTLDTFKETSIQDVSTCQDDNSNDIDDDLETFIKTQSCAQLYLYQHLDFNTQKSVENDLIRSKLELYDNTPRLHHSTEIRKYWHDQKLIHPELYELAMVYLSVPATQVTLLFDFNF